MKKNFILMGITILMATPAVCATDVHGNVKNGDKAAVKTESEKNDTPETTLNLREAVINAYFANQNRTALRLVTIDEKQLRDRGASRTYPELLKGLPSHI